MYITSRHEIKPHMNEIFKTRGYKQKMNKLAIFLSILYICVYKIYLSYVFVLMTNN